MAAAPSNVVSDDEDKEIINKIEEEPQVEADGSEVDDAESVQIDGNEYVAVDIYDSDYYARDDEEEHLFALTECRGDQRVRMRRVTLQKATNKLQRPRYTPEEKECLVMYVDVNGHPAWTL